MLPCYVCPFSISNFDLLPTASLKSFLPIGIIDVAIAFSSNILTNLDFDGSTAVFDTTICDINYDYKTYTVV